MSKSSNYDIIKAVVDKYFDFMEKLDGNHYIAGAVPEEMKDYSKLHRFEGTMRWKAIPSLVTDIEFGNLESYLGRKLPLSYKFFIQYRHFIEMSLGDYQAVFFPNLSSNWMQSLQKNIELYPVNLIERGLIPFADYSDYGVICFNSNTNSTNNHEYPIVWLNHEDYFELERPLATNFVQLFEIFEPHLDHWVTSGRENK